MRDTETYTGQIRVDQIVGCRVELQVSSMAWVTKIYRCHHVKKTKQASHLRTSLSMTMEMPCLPVPRTGEGEGELESTGLAALADVPKGRSVSI